MLAFAHGSGAVGVAARGLRGWTPQNATRRIGVAAGGGRRVMMKALPDGKAAKDMSEKDWREVLSGNQFEVLRLKGTEPPRTGEYDKYYPKSGYFACAACGTPLYSAKSKFDSGCGWPAFDRCYKDAIKTETDISFGMMRTEIMCNTCGSHMGHVFAGERFTETNERHCVNSISVKYHPEDLAASEVKVVE
mmetsp:Transcript_9915/g.26358  ORF Transcript_9915/g.26358 Transcript_9915/m.26358 type:complete len:191 (-) Transcript_9915:991-1563(-)